MKNRNRIIMGSALSLAAVAVAIDHTKHRLPDPVSASQNQADMDDEDQSPCGLDSSSSPCSMDSDDDSESSPCGLGD